LSHYELRVPNNSVSYLKCGPMVLLMGRGDWDSAEFEDMVNSLPGVDLMGDEAIWSDYMIDEATNTEVWPVRLHGVPHIQKCEVQ
jgi:hypothetical protein